MSAPDKIKRLVERFDDNLATYRSGKYNEAQVRQEFIDPFFKELGWDMDNEQDYAEAYKEVIHEDAIKIGGQTKAPDYSFRIGRERKFFLEAKKPSVNIKDEPPPAFQVRRYAWSAKLPLSILTDFEEFAVYDCRVKPEKNDKPSVARIKYITYKDYLSQWDELKSIFSKQAILKGSFDKYAEAAKVKRGTATVDAAFLQEIEGWREVLAKNIALRNPTLSQRDLNVAVQKTIDRIIFLRICEDRGIEQYGMLQDVCKGDETYSRLGKLFERADDRYNSGLFHFTQEKNRPEDPDTFTLGLTIDDKPLKDILNNLYYPESPYEFSVLPADILGQVYEQFLGKVIRLTTGHRAIVEDKPEVKKAGGVYYTPTYIVDYIVKNTLGKLLESKTPNQVAGTDKTSPLRILDPACGSGSFLIGAYQHLLDWHLAWYTANDLDKYAKGKNPKLYQDQAGNWRLTTDERKKILLSNIYGVDIDVQAVEVTKLSLLLKVLEGESQTTINENMRLFQERVLPDLGVNIQCGNSLIGSDFYNNIQLNLFDDEERYRINVFDWHNEFKQVFRDGGFDVVVGNPPYGAYLSRDEDDYLRMKYKVASYQLDTYSLFIEKAKSVTRKNGICGYIIPSAWVASQYDKELREYLISQVQIDQIVICPKRTFVNASVETLILIFANQITEKSSFEVLRWDRDGDGKYTISQSDIAKRQGFDFPIYSSSNITNIVTKMRYKGERLEAYADVVWGVKVYETGKGKPPQKSEDSEKSVFHSDKKVKDTHRPLLGGREIKRYQLDWKGGYIDYGEWLAAPRSPEWFDGERILVREVTANGKIQATIVNGNYVFSNSVDGIRPKSNTFALTFLLGLINSKLFSFFHLYSSANAFKGAFPKLLIKEIRDLPIVRMSLSNEADGQKYARVVQLVTSIMSLYQQLERVNSSQDKKSLERQIVATDRQIDQLVYALYDLTPEEISLVEAVNQ